MDRLRGLEDIQRKMDRGSAVCDFILHVRRRSEVVFHGAVHTCPGDRGLAGEAVGTGILDQKS